MALKRRNAEASKDAAVRFLCCLASPRDSANPFPERVRQHPPQACCRGQEPAAGDEEAPCFLHAQVNLPSQRRIGWVKLRGRLAKTQDMQVVSTGQESRPCIIGFEGVGIWSSMECPMISQRGILKAFGSSFFDNALHTFQQKGLSKNFFQNFHVVQALFSLMIPSSGFLLCCNFESCLALACD